MNELEWIRAFAWSICVFTAYYALEFYVLDGEFDIWTLTLFPMGREILWLGYKYFHILQKGQKKEFVVLKESKYKPVDFIWIVTSIAFIIYVKADVLEYAVPIAIANMFLLYLVKKNQQYYFGEWDILNLTEWDKNINVNDIRSIEFESNLLRIHYGKEDQFKLSQEEEQKELIIRKEQLATPNSWYHFQTMIGKFETEWKAKMEYEKKRIANLHSNHESVS
jgi:hypothetical protein